MTATVHTDLSPPQAAQAPSTKGSDPGIFARTRGNGLGTGLPSLADAGFEEMREARPQGTLRRTLALLRHALGLGIGILAATPQGAHADGFLLRLCRRIALFLRPFLGRAYRHRPWPEQVRLRIERLGPTFIKLGQVLALREDLLPRPLTDELRQLLDRLPAVPFPRFLELVADDLGRPLDQLFAWIEPVPTGSASIAQLHRARTLDGQEVIIKAVKPCIRETLERDARILGVLGNLLSLGFARYRPRAILKELTSATLREADLRQEAQNLLDLAANFADQPRIRFPALHPELCGERVLTLEYLDGFRPDSPAALALSAETRAEIIDLGIGAILRMLFQDGVFHADLHPANLLILPGPQAAFLDLGMVGRLETRLRRSLLYYYYCLVSGDAINAARYLAALADSDRGADIEGFQREVELLSRRWHRSATFEETSFARLVLQSLALGGRFRIRFPMELALMAKALVTFETVGRGLDPQLDVGQASKPHLRRLVVRQWSPLRPFRENLHEAPEWVDTLIELPMLMRDGLEMIGRSSRQPAADPLEGVRKSILGGACLLSGALLLGLGAIGGQGTTWPISALFLAIGTFVLLRTGKPGP